MTGNPYHDKKTGEFTSGPVGSHTDEAGFTVRVVAHERRGGLGPQGEIHLRHPSGRTVKSVSSWMDYPEPGWRWKGIDLEADWERHAAAGTPDQSVWRREVPLKTRLRWEAKQQATGHLIDEDYQPLRSQFREYAAFHREDPPTTLRSRVSAMKRSGRMEHSRKKR